MTDFTTAPANDDPKNTPSYRAARSLAIGLGVLMVLMFLVVVVTLVTRVFSRSNGGQAAAPDAAAIDQLPAGSRITDLKVDSGHVVLRIRTEQGEEIRIVDEASGRVVSRIIAPK